MVSVWCCTMKRTRFCQLYKSLCSELKLKLQFSPSFYSTLIKPLVNPVPDLDYLLNPKYTNDIKRNIELRKSDGDVHKLLMLNREYRDQVVPADKGVLWKQLLAEALKIPNKAHPKAISYGDVPNIIETVGEKPSWQFTPLQFHEIANRLGMLRTENLGNLTGHRTYYFLQQLAQLEQALIHYTVDKLLEKGFTLFSVPDLLHPDIIEGCGMNTKGERTQVYQLDPNHFGEVCLSGTAEMALASYFMNEMISLNQLPIKMAAVSRCYRAETSSIAEERGIYRVHQFTKVEMFGITIGDVHASDGMLHDFLTIQKELFSSLDLHFQVLDMPLHELGPPAYRKFDIEAWMPGRGIFGEISSASNCTDYQARRLGIHYVDDKEQVQFVHTINGTACAVPRMMISLLETNQLINDGVQIPEALQPYCNGLQRLEKTSSPIRLHWIKFKSQQDKWNAPQR